MAILLLNNGKTGETNKDTLRRLAKDKGDTITFSKAGDHDVVILNGKAVGSLFSSHEATIAFLSKQQAWSKKSATKAKAHAKTRKTAKKNPHKRRKR